MSKILIHLEIITNMIKVSFNSFLKKNNLPIGSISPLPPPSMDIKEPKELSLLHFSVELPKIKIISILLGVSELPLFIDCQPLKRPGNEHDRYSLISYVLAIKQYVNHPKATFFLPLCRTISSFFIAPSIA